MSNTLNIGNDLYLGTQEMVRLQGWLRDHFETLFKSAFTDAGGYLNNPNDRHSLGIGGLAVGTTNPYVKLNKGLVIDPSLRVFSIVESDDYYELTSTNNFYFFATYEEQNWEEGTVTIDTSGNLSGLNTLFTEAIRPQPDFQSLQPLQPPVMNFIIRSH